MQTRSLTFATLLLATTLAPCGTWAAEPKCYFPNGSLTSTSTNLTYEACNTIAGATSQCCATSQGCSANGLCISTTGVHTRGGCTDSTFHSPFCLSICASAVAGGSSTGAAEVHECTDGTWCCGDNNATSTCCANGQGITVPITIGMDRGDSASLTSTVKVAIGAGVGAAVLVSLGIVGIVTWRRRRPRKFELQQRLTILSPTRSDHGLLPFHESESKHGEKVSRPKAARVSG